MWAHKHGVIRMIQKLAYCIASAEVTSWPERCMSKLNEGVARAQQFAIEQCRLGSPIPREVHGDATIHLLILQYLRTRSSQI
jgi:hypothetical protein